MNNPKTLKEAQAVLEKLSDNYQMALGVIKDNNDIQSCDVDLQSEEMLKIGYEQMRQKLLNQIEAFENDSEDKVEDYSMCDGCGQMTCVDKALLCDECEESLDEDIGDDE